MKWSMVGSSKRGPTLLMVWNLIINKASGEFSAIIMIRSRKEELPSRCIHFLAYGSMGLSDKGCK